MTVKEFVDGYKKFNNKDQYIEKHILKDTYIPTATKISDCRRIMYQTLYADINNEKKFSRNSVFQYIIFSFTLIDKYTDIDINFGSNELLTDFDLLDECELVDKLIAAVSAHERNNYIKILNMIIDDEIYNNRDIVSYIDNKMDVMKLLSTKFVGNFE